MIRPPELQGKYFHFQLTRGRTLPHGSDRSGLDRGIQRGMTRRITTHLRDHPASPPGKVWQFKYLEYCAGAITRTRLDAPVLTGPMSGCILCRYQNNGQAFIAHIGTANDPDDPNTVAVKADWTRYIASKRGANVVGRKPTQVITDMHVLDQVGKSGGTGGTDSWEVWGYFTPGDAWALLVHRFRTTTASRVVLVEPMPLLPWASIPGKW